MLQPQALFIVGYPRSGTKLLRDLLNNHPDISLGGEGNFIPLMTKRIGFEANVSHPELWPEIYEAFGETSSYKIDKQRGKVLLKEDFIQSLERQSEIAPITWADIFEVIFRAYNPSSQAAVFGDKSHSYVKSAPLLRKIFSNLRLILIVRDPRDQALSVLKTWRRSPLRSAQGWFRMAAAADEHGVGSTSDTLIIRYEDLTSDPARELARACEFLQLPFVSEMTLLKRPVENQRPELNITARPAAQYKQGLSPSTIRRISEITLPYLATYGYPTEGATRHQKLRPLRLCWLKYSDGLASMRYHMKQKGIINGFKYYRSRHLDKVDK